MSEGLLFGALAGAALLPLAWWVGVGLRPLPRLVATAAALAVVGALYLVVGAPERIAPPLDPLEGIARQVEARLAVAPADGEGWRNLGRLRVAQSRFDEAATAFERARTLSADRDPQALIGFAEARVLGDPTRLTGEAAPLIERALTLAPDDPRALWYGGHLAEARGDRAEAERRWRALLAQQPAPELTQALTTLLGAAPLFELEVVVAPDLAARLPAEATLFVFIQGGTGRMPLLARRIAAPTLPMTVALGPGDLLVDGAALDAATALTAGARLSRSGSAEPGPGDLEGRARLERGAPGRARIVIDAERR